MRKLRILVAAIALPGIGIAADAPYRLAGVITPDSGRTMALIETLEGEQQLLRVGDAIDAGRVTEITLHSVRLQFADGEVVLQLVGTDNPEAHLPVQYRQADYSATKSEPIDAETLGAISRLAPSAETIDSKELASQVLQHLKLPAEARIMAINDQPVESPADAVRKMAASIDSKANAGPFQFVISIAAIAGNQRVYVFADHTGQARQVIVRQTGQTSP